jgi:DeoR family transcriptional regulator of aga operon
MPAQGGNIEERSRQILQELLRLGRVGVEDLARKFDVSPSTIRRELRALESRGLLRRTHGGAITIAPMLYEPFRHLSSFQEQESQHATEKRRIGLAAAALIADGETISIGAGTTTTQVARSLVHRKGITVITNSVNVAMELSNRDDLKVFVSGGYLSGDWFALVGPTAMNSIGEIFTDKAFIGVDGIHPELGLTTNYPDQATIHRAMIRQARQRIVVADHGKIGVVGRALIAPATEINILITDSGADDDSVAAFAVSGIEVRRE